MVENVIAHHTEWTVAVYCVAAGVTIHNDWLHARNVNVNFIGVVLCSVKHVLEMPKCIRVNEFKKKKNILSIEPPLDLKT